MPDKENHSQAVELLKASLGNQNLIKHSLAVEAALKALARHFNEDETLWGLVGLLHDLDWEKTSQEFEQHGPLTVRLLKKAGFDDEILHQAILSHNHTHNQSREPESKLEWSLYCCDELTGLIVAVALVRPDRSLADVTVESVLKKFPQAAFAAGVNREQIKLCEEKLGLALPEFLSVVLKAMQEISDELGL